MTMLIKSFDREKVTNIHVFTFIILARKMPSCQYVSLHNLISGIYVKDSHHSFFTTNFSEDRRYLYSMAKTFKVTCKNYVRTGLSDRPILPDTDE